MSYATNDIKKEINLGVRRVEDLASDFFLNQGEKFRIIVMKTENGNF